MIDLCLPKIKQRPFCSVTCLLVIGRIFVVPILCNCHKESPFVLFVQPNSIDLNSGLAILKPTDKWSETPKKMMEFHDNLYYLTLLGEALTMFPSLQPYRKDISTWLVTIWVNYVMIFPIAIDVFIGLLLCQPCFPISCILQCF